ncbi:MAG: isoprenylcysteine carboxylmethyltransferase family protein [Cyclobacteriaceae bacterium]|nr:isoprenylcysteine carboxylmethyltransferase family protein [Cyclobacteriaceae bacterium HetDA_MAG_MS6]
MDNLLLICSWALYYLLHSLFASTAVKDRLQILMGAQYRYYRAIYSLTSILTLVIPLFAIKYHVGSLVFHWEFLIYLGVFLGLAGVLVVILSFRYISGTQFLGISHQVFEKRLVMTGLHKYVRHPIYSGTILVFLSWVLVRGDSTSLITFGCMLAYLPFGIHLEEKKLLIEFGQSYAEYKKRTSAIAPGIW